VDVVAEGGERDGELVDVAADAADAAWRPRTGTSASAKSASSSRVCSERGSNRLKWKSPA